MNVANMPMDGMADEKNRLVKQCWLKRKRDGKMNELQCPVVVDASKAISC